MDLANPIATAIPGTQGIVLGILAATSTPLTGNGIAKLADGKASQSGVSRALGRLVLSGLVRSQPAGRANLYTLNHDHVAARAVIDLASLRQSLIDRIASDVGDWLVPPLAVWLFGSAARSSGDVDSDIDLFVLREVQRADDDVWQAQTMELSERVVAWSGNGCEILDYSDPELSRLIDGDDALITSLRADALPVWGASPTERLGRTHP